jgi:hypothetical protein
VRVTETFQAWDQCIELDGLAFLASCNFGLGLTYLNLSLNSIRVHPQQSVHTQQLPVMHSLVRLVLSHNQLKGNYMATIVRDLPHCPALETLDLKNKHLSDTGVQELPQSIPR